MVRAQALLHHVNLLLAVFGGAALVMSARLKWDPTAYVPLREALPLEYRATAAALTTAGFALVLLPHLAAVAPRARTLALPLLYLYAVLVTTLAVLEAAFSAWLAHRVQTWLSGPVGVQLQEGLLLTRDLQPLLEYLSRWYSLPQRVSELLQEAQEDAPRNMHTAVGAAAALAVLQALAVVLAVCTAHSARRHTQRTDKHSAKSEAAPLRPRTAYRGGRIVLL